MLVACRAAAAQMDGYQASGGAMRRANSVFPHDRRIASVLALLEARFGPAIARRLREAVSRQPEERSIPIGSLALDRATGTGGLPRAHLTELIGAPSSGKTAL